MSNSDLSLGAAIVLVMVLLMLRELARASTADAGRRFARYLQIGIVALLLVSVVNIGLRVYALVFAGG